MIANVVSISGGKDSTATALLAMEDGAKNVHFVFADTGHEHPETYKYVDYLDAEFKNLFGVGIDRVRADFSQRIIDKRQKLIDHTLHLSELGCENKSLKGYTLSILNRMIDNLKPTGNPYLDLCIWKGRFPGTRSAFCTTELKHIPLDNYHQSLLGLYDCVISWQGVRRDESTKRSTLIEKDIEFGGWEPSPYGILIYRPILDWKASRCFEQHFKFGIKPNPLYKKGMGRVGCMPCINCNKSELREIARRYPEVIDRVEEMERLVSLASKRRASTFFDARVTAKYLGTGKTVDDIKTDSHGVRTYAEWAMTSRGGRQYDLITAIEQETVPVCSSVYGLCE